jgi:uncharacterized protein (DUF2344 family)
MKQLILVILLICSACSSVKYDNENQHYIGIKSLIAKDYYSKAILEIYDFQEKYPNSRYICELYNFEIAYEKDRDFSDKHIQKIEKLYNEKCLPLNH